jgi:protein-S-isoprenylcysteine O-methyltransferase Ste14
MLYLSFGICVNHKIGYWILGVMWSFLFVTLILAKEKSLRRKQGWVDYERKSWIFFPKLIPSSDAASLALYAVLGIIVLRLA